MAITILPRETNVGEQWGAALGKGLNALAQKKMQELSTRNGLQALGYSSDQASKLAGLNPQLLNTILTANLKQGPSLSGRATGTGMQGLNLLSGTVSGRNPSQDLEKSVEETLKVGQKPQRALIPSALALEGSLNAGMPGALMPDNLKNLYAKKDRTIVPEITQERPKEKITPSSRVEKKLNEYQDQDKQFNEEEVLLRDMLNVPLKPQERLRVLNSLSKIQSEREKNKLKQEDSSKKLKQLEKKEAVLEQNKIDRETLPFYKESIKSNKSAKENINRLDKIEKLVKRGSLPISAFYNLVEGLRNYEGKGAGFLDGLAGMIASPIAHVLGGSLREIQKNITSRDIEEYEKLQNEFIRGAKEVFGARITNLDLETFMKLIPTLSNTDQGKLKIIQNMREAHELVMDNYKIMKEIINENGGKRPANLELLVEERLSSKLDALADEIKSLIS